MNLYKIAFLIFGSGASLQAAAQTDWRELRVNNISAAYSCRDVSRDGPFTDELDGDRCIKLLVNFDYGGVTELRWGGFDGEVVGGVRVSACQAGLGAGYSFPMWRSAQAYRDDWGAFGYVRKERLVQATYNEATLESFVERYQPADSVFYLPTVTYADLSFAVDADAIDVRGYPTGKSRLTAKQYDLNRNSDGSFAIETTTFDCMLVATQNVVR